MQILSNFHHGLKTRLISFINIEWLLRVSMCLHICMNGLTSYLGMFSFCFLPFPKERLFISFSFLIFTMVFFLIIIVYRDSCFKQLELTRIYMSELECSGISNVAKKLYWQITCSFTLHMKGQLILIRSLIQ